MEFGDNSLHLENYAHHPHLRISSLPGIHCILSIKNKQKNQATLSLNAMSDPGLDPGAEKKRFTGKLRKSK